MRAGSRYSVWAPVAFANWRTLGGFLRKIAREGVIELFGAIPFADDLLLADVGRLDPVRLQQQSYGVGCDGTMPFVLAPWASSSAASAVARSFDQTRSLPRLVRMSRMSESSITPSDSGGASDALSASAARRASFAGSKNEKYIDLLGA